MPNKFDLRLRRLPNALTNPRVRYRCVLLPHRTAADGADVSWARSRHPLPLAEGETDHPDRGKLWLPPAGTTLNFTAPPVADLGERLRRLTLVGPPKEPMAELTNGNGPGGPATLTCFGGLKLLLSSADAEDARETLAGVQSARGTKEFLLTLIEAFRFEGSLEEFAQIGNVELMACLSHLVFEVEFLDDQAAAGMRQDATWQAGALLVTLPGGPERAEIDAAESDFEETSYSLDAAVPPRPSTEGPLPMPIQAVQRADGVYFRLLEPQMLDTKDENGLSTGKRDDQFRLLLRRSDGNIPLEVPPIIESSYWGFERLVMPARAGADVPNAAAADLVPITLAEQTFHIVDRHPAESLAGRQLHYRLDAIDGFGTVHTSASISLRRERYDPPPQPVAAVVRLITPPAGGGGPWKIVLHLKYLYAQVAQGSFPAESELATWANEMQEEFALELYQQERPLDECGFYGDDDDFALLEGLRQADALYEPRSETDTSSPMPGHPLEEQMRGRYDRDGLARVEIPAPEWKAVKEPATLTEAQIAERVVQREYAQAVVEIAFPDKNPPGWLRPLRGYQFHAGLARKREEGLIRANLSACEHRLGFADLGEEPEKSIQVFQLELFPLERAFPADLAANRRFLARDCFDLYLLEPSQEEGEPGGRGYRRQLNPTDLAPATKDAPPLGVELVFTHPAAGHPDFQKAIVDSQGRLGDQPPWPVGGVRVLLRDRVAKNEALPFRVAETIQVLPQTVSLYRPLAIESGVSLVPLYREHSLFAPGDFSPDTPRKELPNADTLQRFFGPGGTIDKLREELRALTESATPAFDSQMFSERTTELSTRDGDAAGRVFLGAFDTQTAELEELQHRRARPDLTAEQQQQLNQEITDKIGDLKTAIAERAQSWLEKTKKAMRVGLEPYLALEAKQAALQQRHDDPSTQLQERLDLERDIKRLNAELEQWWPAMSSMLTTLRQLGLTRDFVVRMANVANAWALVEAAAQKLAAIPYLKVFVVQSPDGENTADVEPDIMATIRVAAMPWWDASPAPARPSLLKLIFPDSDTAGSEDARWLRIYTRCVRSRRLMLYRDVSRAPLNLALHPGRLVRYRWHGLRDSWHHDLEFAVQLLDRYQHVRDRYLRARGATDEQRADRRKSLQPELEDHLALEAEALLDHAVKPITVPRLEPILLPPGLFPAAHRPPWFIAFEVLDSDERQKAAHNALARTRFGNLQLHLSLRSEFPDQARYLGGALSYLRQQAGVAGFYGWWCDRLLAAGKQLRGDAQETCVLPHAGPAARRVVERPFLTWDTAGLTQTAAVTEVPGRGLCEVIPYPDEPHYLTFHQDCYYSADYLASGRVRASAEREPWLLALPFRPDFEFSNLAGSTLNLKIRLTPALLGSHLNKEELERSTGRPQWELRDGVPIGATGFVLGPAGLQLASDNGPGDIPLPLLPDLWAEYTFFLDLGGNKFAPLFEWKAPRERGTLAPNLTDAEDAPLGFKAPQSLAPALLGDLQAHWLLAQTERMAAVELTGKLTLTDPGFAAELHAHPEGRLRMTMRRRALGTDLLPLKARPSV